MPPRASASKICYFYPRPPRGGRPGGGGIRSTVHRQFLPTPSARRATYLQCGEYGTKKGFLPTPSARRATGALYRERSKGRISTHALREEGDLMPSAMLSLPVPQISTHALREEGDFTTM